MSNVPQFLIPSSFDNLYRAAVDRATTALDFLDACAEVEVRTSHEVKLSKDQGNAGCLLHLASLHADLEDLFDHPEAIDRLCAAEDVLMQSPHFSKEVA